MADQYRNLETSVGKLIVDGFLPIRAATRCLRLALLLGAFACWFQGAPADSSSAGAPSHDGCAVESSDAPSSPLSLLELEDGPEPIGAGPDPSERTQASTWGLGDPFCRAADTLGQPSAFRAAVSRNDRRFLRSNGSANAGGARS